MTHKKLIRVIDLISSVFGLFFLSPLIVLLTLLIFFQGGSPIFVQERVGKNLKPFRLFKFRTMRLGTKDQASHLVSNTNITVIGRFMRKIKLDEIPQLVNVAKGEMSLVGPRPCLFSQKKLIKERLNLGVYDYKPGITGLAQIKRIDMSTPLQLAKVDALMVKSFSIRLYFKYIFLTVTGSGSGDAIKK